MGSVGDERSREDRSIGLALFDGAVNGRVAAKRGVKQEDPGQQKGDDCDQHGEDDLFRASALEALA